MRKPPRIAFYAPLKPPTHPTPSGDRTMARLFLGALESAGFAPHLASELRSFARAPAIETFEAIRASAEAEASALIDRYLDGPAAERPKLWFTYHLFYKAPDFLGPRVAAALDIPYAVAEASIAEKRMRDDWAPFAEDAAAGVALADLIIALTRRDWPGLEARVGRTQRLRRLPPFLDPGGRPAEKPPAAAPYRLLSVAMMRPGDKLASYRLLAAALQHVRSPWRLDIVGDGAARADVEALFADFGDRVAFRGALHDPDALRAAYHKADLFLWPGVGEAFGMVYLEANATQTPIVAEARPGLRDVARGGGARLCAPDNPDAFAAAVDAALSDPRDLRAMGRRGRAKVLRRHSVDAAAARLRDLLAEDDLVDMRGAPALESAEARVARDRISLQ